MSSRVRMKPWISALVLSAGGCSEPASEPSTDVATGSLSVFATLQSNGDLVQIVARVTDTSFHVAPEVDLAGGDALVLGSPGGVRQVLTPYRDAYLGQVGATETTFGLVLERGADRLSATMTLPPPFSLSGPAVGPASRSQGIPLSWQAAPGSGGIVVSFTGGCVTRRIDVRLPQDTGAFTVDPASLSTPASTGPCDLEVAVWMGRGNEEDAPWLWMQQIGQIRSLTIATVP